MGLFGSIFKGVTSLIGGNSAAKATKQAAQLQYQAAQQGIAEQARQFDLTRADYAPYQAFGAQGVQKYGDLAGLNGNDAQTSAIAALRASPIYQSLYHNGEQAALANGAATGGLRGGNTEGSLYNLGTDTLSNLILQQLGAYGNAIGVGSGAVGAVGSFGANAAANEAALRGQGADANAQSALIRGGIASQNWNNVGSSLSDIFSNIFKSGGTVSNPSAASFAGVNWAKAF